jgi:hypothetical protein
MAQLRLAAGMMQLWGTPDGQQWLPGDFHTGLTMDNNAAGRMVLFHARFLENMARYRQRGVRHVEVFVVDDQATCASCRALKARRIVALRKMPELPHASCTRAMGCRCSMASPDFV